MDNVLYKRDGRISPAMRPGQNRAGGILDSRRHVLARHIDGTVVAVNHSGASVENRLASDAHKLNQELPIQCLVQLVAASIGVRFSVIHAIAATSRPKSAVRTEAHAEAS